jgi:AcrR family transcriptional regulator
MTIKEKLIDSATSMFLRYGVKSVSMDDMARLMGISKKTIYNHVDNKKGLVSTVIETFIKKEHKEIKKISKNASNAIEEMTMIANMVLKTLRMMKPKLTYDIKKYHPQLWTFIEEVHFSFMKETIRKNIIRGQKEGLYRAVLDDLKISKIYFGIVRLCMDEDGLDEDAIPISELFSSFISYHLHAIINDKGRKELNKQLKSIAL